MLTALEVDGKGTAAIIGSDKGVLRVMDVTGRSLVRILYLHRLMKKPITCIKISPD
jgi:hypothetical protein